MNPTATPQVNPETQNLIQSYKASNPTAYSAPSTGGDWYSQLKAGAYRPAGIAMPKPVTTFGGDTKGSAGQEMKADVVQRIQNDKQINQSNQNLPSKILQNIGQGAGAINDVVTDAIKPLIPSNIKQGVKNALAEDSKKQDFTTSPQAQALKKAFSDFTAAHPEATSNLKAGGNILSTLLLGEGAGSAGKVIKTVGEVGAKGIDAATTAIKGTAEEQVAKAVANGAKTDAKNLQTSIQHTMPAISKDVRVSDLENTFPDSGVGKGGITREGALGKSTPQPTTQDIQRGTTAHEYINGEKDPVQRIAKVNQGIRDTSNATDSFLDQNSTPSNFEDMRDYVEANNTPDKGLKDDPAAYKAYQRTSENALDTLYKTMKTTAKETGDFGAVTPGSDIRQARIAVDQQIKAELKGATLGTPQYTGIKAAAVSARNVLNRMAEDMLRYPGQMEQLNKFNADMAELSKRGIEVDPAEAEGLKAKYGLKSTAESEANAQKLSDQQSKMSDLYDARDNMIDKYQSLVGKEKWQEYLKNNPRIRKALRYGAIGIGAGIVGHEL